MMISAGLVLEHRPASGASAAANPTTTTIPDPYYTITEAGLQYIHLFQEIIRLIQAEAVEGEPNDNSIYDSRIQW